jgi:hypothetical protein
MNICFISQCPSFSPINGKQRSVHELLGNKKNTCLCSLFKENGEYNLQLAEKRKKKEESLLIH